jgi:hypothetical protein
MDTSCSLCSFPTDSLVHLFFSCPIARVVWRNSYWPMDTLALHISSITDWLDIILNPEKIGIPFTRSHLFQIFLRQLHVIIFGLLGTKLFMMI